LFLWNLSSFIFRNFWPKFFAIFVFVNFMNV